jgi:hypothetical protein
MCIDGFTLRMSRSATGQSCASPPVNKIAIKRPLASASAWIFVLRPPGQQPVFAPPFSACRRAVGFDVRRVDHLHIRRSSAPGELPEQVFPDSASCPAHEAVIDCRRRTIDFRAITPPTAALEHMHDPADDAPIVCPLHATHVRRQMRLDPRPLFVAQPEQIPASILPPIRISIVLSKQKD